MALLIIPIILSKGPGRPKLAHEIFFWIGSESPVDSYSTAAFKAVELDKYLRNRALEFREKEGEESKRFKELFSYIQYLSGGEGSGLDHYEPVDAIETKPELYRVKGVESAIEMKKVKCRRDQLNSSDVFILDKGTSIWQWNGHSANTFKKQKANEFLESIVAVRGSATVKYVLEEGNDQHAAEFWDA